MKMIFTTFEIELRNKKDRMAFAKQLESLCKVYAKTVKDSDGDKYQNYDFIWEEGD